MGYFGIDNIFKSKTKLRYMENGFTESEAEAMSWICQQKAKGKFIGAGTGLVLAVTWGHWHDKIMNYFKFHWSRGVTQIAIIMSSILFFDYVYTGHRRGANELIANKLMLNNNLFLANINSLVENFDIFERKFTPEEIEAFNYRKNLIRTNHHEIDNKKWIYNDKIYTPEEFAKRIRSATVGPWNDAKIYDHILGNYVISKPSNIGRLIDETGDRLGINHHFVYGWSPIH